MMTFRAFQQQRRANKVRLVITQGTYLTYRGEGLAETHLYHLAGRGRGFFVELRYEPQLRTIVVCHSFTGSEQLAAYLDRVQLPAG